MKLFICRACFSKIVVLSAVVLPRFGLFCVGCGYELEPESEEEGP